MKTLKIVALMAVVSSSALTGCISTDGHMLQGRAINGGYDTYRVTYPNETIVFKDGTTKTFDANDPLAQPTTYLNHGFLDKCEGKARLITVDGQEAMLLTSQFHNISPEAKAKCAK